MNRNVIIFHVIIQMSKKMYTYNNNISITPPPIKYILFSYANIITTIFFVIKVYYFFTNSYTH